MSSVPDSVAAVIRNRAAADPAAQAISGDSRPVSYGELDERSSRLAAALARLGVRPGDRVAYLDQNATEFWETAFAAAKLGAVLTPLNFRLAGPEVRAILDDCEPAVLVAAAPLLAGLGPQAVPDATRVVVIGGGEAPGGSGGLDYEDVLTAEEPADPGRSVTGSDLAVLMYSSGTTGASKGVRITSDNLLCAVAAFLGKFRPDSSSRSLVPPPPGQTGEIVLRGANVTPGYWRRPAESEQLFLPGGWLRTGDAGHLDADGYVTIAGRIKDIIISGGENIIPAEIEQVLHQRPP